MNGFEFNKIFAAILIALLVAWVGGFVADKLVHAEMPEKNSYVVEGVNAAPAATTAEAPKGPAPIAPLLKTASVEAGQKAARVCGTCHSFGKGEPAKIGPNLYGIVGAKHAHMAGYDYSEALKAMAGHEWDYDELNEFIYNPRQHVVGTKMSFAGLKNDQERANVIAWLRTLADSPVPLPE